jgi:hypothetical protein
MTNQSEVNELFNMVRDSYIIINCIFNHADFTDEEKRQVVKYWKVIVESKSYKKFLVLLDKKSYEEIDKLLRVTKNEIEC